MTKKAEKRALSLLERLGINLKVLKTITNLRLNDGRDYTLPPHSEKAWFREYIKNLIEERGMNPEKIEDLTRESYASLRYKQALAGSSDGSGLGAMLALGGHVETNHAKEVYQAALKEYDSLRDK